VGWPEGHREIYCHMCDGFRTKFKFENVHPVLRILEDTPVCIRGHGPRLYLRLNIVFHSSACASCFDDYSADITAYARDLIDARDAVATLEVADNYFSRPLCSVMILDYENPPPYLNDPLGVKVKDILFRLVHQYNRYIVRQIKHTEDAFLFWEEAFKPGHEITDLDMAQVEEIMNHVAGWERVPRPVMKRGRYLINRCSISTGM
jgi:hypothetical protein